MVIRERGGVFVTPFWSTTTVSLLSEVAPQPPDECAWQGVLTIDFTQS